MVIHESTINQLLQQNNTDVYVSVTPGILKTEPTYAKARLKSYKKNHTIISVRNKTIIVNVELSHDNPSNLEH
jgi:hypothetical protein